MAVDTDPFDTTWHRLMTPRITCDLRKTHLLIDAVIHLHCQQPQGATVQTGFGFLHGLKQCSHNGKLVCSPCTKLAYKSLGDIGRDTHPVKQ